jgi:formylglycine-generating enzyme required for sulfatase activity
MQEMDPQPERIPQVLELYLQISQYPILGRRIRARMREELFARGVITPQMFENEVKEKAVISQKRERVQDPFAQESIHVWQERLEQIRDHLTDFYFAYNLPHVLFEEIVQEVLAERAPGPTVSLSFNPELAPPSILLAQAKEYAALPYEQRGEIQHHLREITVVLTKSMISDQMGFVSLAKEFFNAEDFETIAQRRIGQGKIGGKAAGMMLAWKILQREDPADSLNLHRHVVIPDSYFIGADVFYDFHALNELDKFMNQKYKSQEDIESDYPHIQEAYLHGEFPERVSARLRQLLIDIGNTPLIVRSSSLLEDNFGFSFAGKYDSFFCPNQGVLAENMEALTGAIRRVYASVLSPDALLYRQRMGLVDYDERMAILIQKVQGQRYGDYFFPSLAGDWLDAADANLRRLGEAWMCGRLLPIRVVLRDYAARGLPRDMGLWEFIGEELGKVKTESVSLGDCLPVLRSYLERETGAILLLDGVDEVPEAHRCRVRLKEAIEQFRRDFPHCRILVTSRPYAYQDPEAHLARFEVRRLAPFTPEQVQTFIHRWYEHVGQKDPALGPENAARYADQLAHAVETRPRLADLAPNPLLLTLMASLHRWREGGSLPERRQELYERSVILLIDLWQRPKQIFDAQGDLVGEEYDVFTELGIPQDNLRSALNLVAYEAHREQPALTGTHDIRARKLAGALYEAATDKGKAEGPDRVIHYLMNRAGLLIEREQGRVYTFPHRTFQEYLAACYLTREDYPYLLAERLREDDARWREATLLAAAKAVSGTPNAIWTLLFVFCPHEWPPPEAEPQTEADWYAALRAAQALIETEQHLRVPGRQRYLLERLRAWLAELIAAGRLPPPERAAAGQALARLPIPATAHAAGGDPRAGVGVDGTTGLPDLRWCLVPPGPFLMGSRKEDDREAYDDEMPQHTYDVPYPYAVALYPITNAQFRAFVEDSDGYRSDRWWTRAGLSWRKERAGPDKLGGAYALPNHPAVMITWYEALAWCCWLSASLQGTGSLPEGWEVRLPSEAEWEKAARGGLQILDKHAIQTSDDVDRGFQDLALAENPLPARRYPWGDDLDPSRANYDETGIGSTCAVGIFPDGASPYGCLDLSGNVWEWCASKWVDSYKDCDQKEDNGLEGEDPRVVRGGAFYFNRGSVRCAYRVRHNPVGLDRSQGFRPVVAPADSGL